MNLVARPDAREDYSVLADGEPVGRIRHALERTPPIWVWHVQLLVPIPPWGNGSAGSRPAAMAAFREAFTRLKTDIGPARYAAAIENARAARARFTRQ